MFWKGHKNLANLPLFFWHYLEVSNYKWEMGHLLWPSQNIRTLWLLHWFNKRLEGFLDFLEKYEMELTIYFIFFSSSLLSGAHRPHCPKATKLTYVWCNLKKNYTTQNDAWTKIQSLSQPVNFSNKKKQRNGNFVFMKLPTY